MRGIRILLACAFVCAVLACGCSPHLAGTNDAALEYSIEADPATGRTNDPTVTASVTATKVKARLSAAQIAADVDATSTGRVRVVVDSDAAASVDALVLWPGGLTVTRAAAAGSEPEAEVLATLPIATIATALHGRALALTFPEHARDPLQAEQARAPATRVVISRAHSPIATMPIDAALATPLVLPFGDDITAYTRADRNEQVLASPPLPPMRRETAERLPPDRGLAAACALLPLALSFAWLAFVRRFDRARPEPMWLVIATFALGCLSVVPAGLAEIACARLTPWLDPSVMTLGGQVWALPLSIAVFTLVVGGAEEGSKFLGAWSLARHRREFDEPIDGIIYGSAAALGFAAVENVKYFAMGRMSGALIAVRTFVSVPAHLFFGAMWGYALGRRLVSRKTSVLGFFALAALAHGTFDALASADGMVFASTALIFALALAFVAMLRSALRYGAIGARAAAEGAPLTDPLPAGELSRRYFRVGSPGAFYACAAGIVLCAIVLTLLGGAYEYLHHRIGVVFVGIATSILGVFGVAAYGAAETIPLDVAIDAQGVTYGGGRTPWRALVSVSLDVRADRAHVILYATDRVTRLGPTSAATAHAIAAAIRSAHPLA